MRHVLPVFLLMLLLLLGVVQGHVPLLPSPGIQPDAAVQIEDANKSWAAYALLPQGAIHYYRFDREAGQRIHLEIITSPQDPAFAPGFVLMGAGLPKGVALRPDIVVPEGYGAVLVNGSVPDDAVYEPFAPSAYRKLGGLDMQAPQAGEYLVAVFAPSMGNYGLVVGFEEAFTLEEWILLPLRLISVYRWEGQSLPAVFAPILAVLVAGYYFLNRRRPDLSQPRALASLAGLLFLGSCASILYQMTYALTRSSGGEEAYITAIFAAISATIGAAALYLALRGRDREFSVREKVGLRIVGVLALLAGSGLLIGPLLTIISTAGGRSRAADKPADGKARKPKGLRGQ